MLEQDKARRSNAADGLKEGSARNAVLVLAAFVIQINVASLFLMWLFQEGWAVGVVTLVLAGLAGGFALPLLLGSWKPVFSWMTASVPITVLFSVFSRTELAACSGFSYVFELWPRMPVALASAGSGAWLGVMCASKLLQRGKRIRDRLRLTIWLIVLSLITAASYVGLTLPVP
jgi:hypothetical protein